MSPALTLSTPHLPTAQHTGRDVPLFTIELGTTERGTCLLLDLFSHRWQALLQRGTPASTAFLWQQVIRSLAERHRAPEVQVTFFTPRPTAFAWHVLDWDPRWLVTSHPGQLLQTLLAAYEDRNLPDAPAVHLFLLDEMEAFLDNHRSERLLQMAFLEGSRHGLRLMGAWNGPGRLPSGHPLMQCFTHTVRYLGDGWYGLEHGAGVLRFILSIQEVLIPERVV